MLIDRQNVHVDVHWLQLVIRLMVRSACIIVFFFYCLTFCLTHIKQMRNRHRHVNLTILRDRNSNTIIIKHICKQVMISEKRGQFVSKSYINILLCLTIYMLAMIMITMGRFKHGYATLSPRNDALQGRQNLMQTTSQDKIHPVGEVDTSEAPRILHIVWGRPNQTDQGHKKKARILDDKSFTGCCDNMIHLALKSYIAMLPNDFRILFWNLGGGLDTNAYLEHIGLKNETIIPMTFDPLAEFANETNLIELYQSLSIVPRSDLARYALMRNYGGNYVDLDGVMVRPLPLDGTPRFNLNPHPKTHHAPNCSGRPEGQCVLSNGKLNDFDCNLSFIYEQHHAPQVPLSII